MAFDELAQRLFGARRAESDAILTDATTGTIHGVALTDSEGGAVTVEITADVTAPEPLEVGGETYFADAGVGVEIPTSESVRAGDEVLVSTYGAGTMRSPVVTAAVGSGDRMAAAVQDAHDLAASVEGIAQEAKEVAEATGQHFWPDESGVHVTEVTQDEWSDSTSTGYHSGANVLLNALGQLFRDGLNNILAIVSGSDPGVAIYDGEGNAADNIVALFSKALIRIGGRLLGTGTSTASVQFFESDASQTDIKATHTVGTTTPPTGPDDVYGVNHGVQVTTSTDDSELGAGAEGHAAWAALDLFADVNPDYEAGSAMLKATTGGTPYDSSTDPTLGVLRQVADNGLEYAEIYMAAPTLALNDIARYKTGRVPMEQAIAALTTPVYSKSSNLAVSTANSDCTGPSVTVSAGNYILVVTYAFPTASGSGTRETTLGVHRTDGVALYNQVRQGNRSACRMSFFDVVHPTSSVTYTAYARSDVTCGSNTCYIGLTRIS